MIGAISLFGAALGISITSSRLVADVLRVGYLRESRRWTESRLYFVVVWTLIACGTAILLSGFDQPLSLVVVAGRAERWRDVHLLDPAARHRHRRFLPDQLKVRGIRMLALMWATALFGVMSVLVVINEAAG